MHTKSGYALYLVSLTTLFLLPIEAAIPLKWCSLLFVGYTYASCWFLFLAAKFPPSRRFIDGHLGSDYIVKYLGAHTVTLAVIKGTVPLATLIIGEIAANKIQHLENIETADKYRKEVFDSWKESNYQPWVDERREVIEKALEIRTQPTLGLGKTFKWIFDVGGK